jgi:hypothetical protein
MPARVLHFEGLWSSDKLAACAEWARAEYAWCYGLADTNGGFEPTNLKVAYVKSVRCSCLPENTPVIFRGAVLVQVAEMMTS